MSLGSYSKSLIWLSFGFPFFMFDISVEFKLGLIGGFSVNYGDFVWRENGLNFPFPNFQNFPFQTVKISLSKLSKFPFPNCQNFPFQTVKIFLIQTVKIFHYQTVKISLFKLSKFLFPNCQNSQVLIIII